MKYLLLALLAFVLPPPIVASPNTGVAKIYWPSTDALYPHTCNLSALTTLIINEQQPRSILYWAGDKVYIDHTALINVGYLDILLHGQSTILVPDLLYENMNSPYLQCSLQDLYDEARAHGFMLEDGNVCVELEELLKRHELPRDSSRSFQPIE